MNDFTKEELEFLKHSVREHYKNNKPIKGSTYINEWAIMIKKIQYMIDNYYVSETSNLIEKNNNEKIDEIQDSFNEGVLFNINTENPYIKVRCDKCKKILILNIYANINTPWVKDCSLHNSGFNDE